MSDTKKDISSVLRFTNYIVNNVQFTHNDQFSDDTIDIDFDIEKSVNYNYEGTNTINVTLFIKLFDKPKENNYPFSLYLEITGIFELDDLIDGQKHPLAEQNAVAILFPYARALITTYTSNSNVPPLILPPINVVKLMSDRSES